MLLCVSAHFFQFTLCLSPTGEALTQSSLLEADGENMTTAVEPMNLHHAMLRSPGGCLCVYGGENPQAVWLCSNPAVNCHLTKRNVAFELQSAGGVAHILSGDFSLIACDSRFDNVCNQKGCFLSDFQTMNQRVKQQLCAGTIKFSHVA